MKPLILSALLGLPGLAHAVCPSQGSIPTCQDCRITYSSGIVGGVLGAQLTGKPNGLAAPGWSLYTAVAPRVKVGTKATVTGTYSQGVISANLTSQAGLLANAAEVVIWVKFVQRDLLGKIVDGPCEYGQKVAYRPAQLPPRTKAP